jgi:hypothetical protein
LGFTHIHIICVDTYKVTVQRIFENASFCVYARALLTRVHTSGFRFHTFLLSPIASAALGAGKLKPGFKP